MRKFDGGLFALGSAVSPADLPCACAKYATPLHNMADVMNRYRVSRSIVPTLDVLALLPQRRFTLFRCRACGQYWQESFGWAQVHDALYPVPEVAVEQWLREPFPDQAATASWRGTFDSLGPEVGPEACREPGCRRRRAHLSVFCPKHHWVRNLGGVLPEPDVMPLEYRE
jgi:hypothetical protein